MNTASAAKDRGTAHRDPSRSRASLRLLRFFRSSPSDSILTLDLCTFSQRVR